MCFTKDPLLCKFGQPAAVLKYRRSAFKALGCPNIDAYTAYICQ